ncbi:replicative DNA helicase [Azospirillum sp.]|uniref:replicative DNA helicase n=1 Tax=Azospirillum sp. TaxID=34012 RepID=UPI003D747096
MTPHDLPHNEQIEQALLGCLLFSPGAINRVIGKVSPEDFHDPDHGAVFAVALELAEAGKPVNYLTVVDALSDAPVFAPDGGPRKYLVSLHEAYVTASEAPHYAQRVRELRHRRQLVEFAAWLSAEARRTDLDASATAIVAQAEGALAEILEAGSSHRKAADLKATLAAAWDTIQRAQAAVNGVSGVATGLADLDRLTGGLQPADLIILAGRPSMGKTALALTMTVNAASQGHETRFQSLEMSRAQLGLRLYARRTGISMQDQRRPLHPSQLAELEAAQQHYAGLRLTVDDEGGLTAGQIRARARAHKRKHGLGLLTVDYLGLVSPSGATANKVHQVEEVTKALKETAKELEIPVLLLCQLSRAVESREDKRPQLSDLRDSGAIEQDADVVMFVYRPEYYLERSEPQRRPDEAVGKFNDRYSAWEAQRDAARNVGEVIVAKNRQGEIGTARLFFDGRRQTFENLDRRTGA